MYQNVMVAVDNSDCSRYAVDLGIELARATSARLTGNHVYAARLHDVRFRQLEPGLPGQFQTQPALQQLRGTHEELIGRGLGIISESYLDGFEARCREAGVEAARKIQEGRNYLQLVRDARESRYDLVIVGAHGLGRVDRSILGTVCERVARLVECDLLVTRTGRSLGSGPLLVAIDGSAHSFAALRVALGLSRIFGNPLSAVAAYDPFYHVAAFRSLAGVLSDEAASLFRFREQEWLHDEIIDSGLKSVYHAHLQEAQRMAAREGHALEIEVLEGKPFDAIAMHLEKLRPALLLAGRIGVHHAEEVTLGSTVENLLRLAEANILVVNQGVDRGAALASTIEGTDAAGLDGATGGAGPASRPSAGPTAVSLTTIADGEPIGWSEAAEGRLGRVPPFVRRMVRRRIEGFAREHGYRLITLEVYDQARQGFGMGGGFAG